MEVWSHILHTLNYQGEDDFELTAEDIKKCKETWRGPANQFEPRLLCYQTSSDSRPAIFKEKGICILPIKNGTYILTKADIYMPLVYDDSLPILINRDNTSVILNIGSSETSVIDNLRYSGVFERDEILGEKITHGPLLNGRHRVNLTMSLNNRPVSIAGVQYETDSCFESRGKILLIEGKSSNKPITSFNIRQLYFPYREAKRLAADRKEIISLFIHDFNGTIHIWKFTFAEPEKMDSITLKGHYAFKFNS